MANLQAIYNEFGLSGLIPYALRAGTRGHQMLVEKIRDGDALYLLKSTMNAPYLIVKDGVYQTPCFTSLAAAEVRQQELSAERFETSIEELVIGDTRADRLCELNEDGVAALLVDEVVSVSLDFLVELPAYDGQPNEEHLLRNHALNGNLFYCLQISCAQKGNTEAEANWAKSMAASRFILAVEDDAANNYPLIRTTAKKNSCVMAFTDWRQLRMTFDGFVAGLTVSFDELCEVVAHLSDFSVLLNKGSCHMILDQDMILMIRQILTGIKFSSSRSILVPASEKERGPGALYQVSEDEWESADPTPDFLK